MKILVKFRKVIYSICYMSLDRAISLNKKSFCKKKKKSMSLSVLLLYFITLSRSLFLSLPLSLSLSVSLPHPTRVSIISDQISSPLSLSVSGGVSGTFSAISRLI